MTEGDEGAVDVIVLGAACGLLAPGRLLRNVTKDSIGLPARIVHLDGSIGLA